MVVTVAAEIAVVVTAETAACTASRTAFADQSLSDSSASRAFASRASAPFSPSVGARRASACRVPASATLRSSGSSGRRPRP